MQEKLEKFFFKRKKYLTFFQNTIYHFQKIGSKFDKFTKVAPEFKVDHTADDRQREHQLNMTRYIGKK